MFFICQITMRAAIVATVRLTVLSSTLYLVRYNCTEDVFQLKLRILHVRLVCKKGCGCGASHNLTSSPSIVAFHESKFPPRISKSARVATTTNARVILCKQYRTLPHFCSDNERARQGEKGEAIIFSRQLPRGSQ